MRSRRAERAAEQMAVERLDVLEDGPDEITRWLDARRRRCSARGCTERAFQLWRGRWSEHYLCSRHRPLYRVHDALLRRIRSL